MTVIDDQWWFNSKIDGKGAFLHDSPRPPVGAPNLAEQHPEVARELFALGKDDAGGSFPDFVIERAKGFADASGCSPFAAIAGAQ